MNFNRQTLWLQTTEYETGQIETETGTTWHLKYRICYQTKTIIFLYPSTGYWCSKCVTFIFLSIYYNKNSLFIIDQNSNIFFSMVRLVLFLFTLNTSHKKSLFNLKYLFSRYRFFLYFFCFISDNSFFNN